MSTETCIIPEDKDREIKISGRGFITTDIADNKRNKRAVLQRCAVPLISDVQFYIPLFNQVSGEDEQTCHITTNQHNNKTSFRTKQSITSFKKSAA